MIRHILTVALLAAAMSPLESQTPTSADSMHAKQATARADSLLASHRQYCKTKNPTKYICADTVKLKAARAAEQSLIGSSSPTPTPPKDTTPTPIPPTPGLDTAKVRKIVEIEGPLSKVTSTPAALIWYEGNYSFYDDSLFRVFGPAWDADNVTAGYDPAATDYVWWVRTGNPVYYDRGHAKAVDYISRYLTTASGEFQAPSPHYAEPRVLYLECMLSGDMKGCDYLYRTANAFLAFTIDQTSTPGSSYISNLAHPDVDQRIQARAIDVMYHAEKMDAVFNPGKISPWKAWTDSAITQTLRTLNANGYAPFASTCGAPLNYMVGFLYDILTQIYDRRPGPYNAKILSSVKAFAAYAWANQWLPASKSFKYVGVDCVGTGGPSPAPDLNGFLLPMYGWLGKTTGDNSYFAKGDSILAGMPAAYIIRTKQFTESYLSSYRYLAYRPASLPFTAMSTARAAAPMGTKRP